MLPRPWAIIRSAIFWAVLIGTAKPMPTLPLRCRRCDLGVDPDHLARGVEQRAARVAGVDRRVGLDHVVDRGAVGALDVAADADTMPAVTVWSRPNGLPIATTVSPTRTLGESPSCERRQLGRSGVDLRAPRGRTRGRRRRPRR